MPTSPYCHIETLAAFLIFIRPTSVLDIGLGNGKIGFIVRDCLDVTMGERYKRSDWKVILDGIEIFPDYIQDHQKAIYNKIFIGNAFEYIDVIGVYDLIIAGDVLEHFEKNKAWSFLDKCAAHCNKYLILNLPLGEKWEQPTIYGNPHEKHLSSWTQEELAPFTSMKQIYSCKEAGDYGCFLIKKEDYLSYRQQQTG
ncbi:MAG: class I SAM-dependent methyltransferase [Nitrospirae bacterium]|nr:class I SAM-dependent methyltransferase [Nitrospirota bacterium]